MTAAMSRRDARTLCLSSVDSRGAVIDCRAAADVGERMWHYRIRHRVFVVEQGVFTGSDLDRHDLRPDVVHGIAVYHRAYVGTVRFFPLHPDTGLWQGDRLAVLPQYRTAGIGGPLVRFAVAAAKALGGRRMIAHVQLGNVRFFERLGWRRSGEVETYVGLPHQPMTIALAPAAETE